MVAAADEIEIRMYQIADWDEHYESSETKKIRRLAWVPIPNATGGSYYELVDAHGARGLGVWVALVQHASRRERRKRTGRFSGSIRAISRQSGVPPEDFHEVVPTLLQIGWLQALTPDTESRPVTPRKGSGRNPKSRGRKPDSAPEKQEEGSRKVPSYEGNGSPAGSRSGGAALGDPQKFAQSLSVQFGRDVSDGEAHLRNLALSRGIAGALDPAWTGWRKVEA